MRVLRPRAFNLARDQRGASAVEFALVALPLLLFLLGILELGLIFVMNFNLSNASSSLGRQLRVGLVIAPGAAVATSSGAQLDLTDFKTAICSKIGLVPNATCMSQLQVDVRTLTSFQNQTPPNPIIGKTFNTSGFCFYSGSAGSVVELRAYYLWPVITPVLLNGLVNITGTVTGSGSSSGNWFLISSTEVFKNEPSSGITNTGNSC